MNNDTDKNELKPTEAFEPTEEGYDPKKEKKAHIGWTTRAHSAHAVPIFAIGPNAQLFSGWHDNSDIVPLIKKAVLE